MWGGERLYGEECCGEGGVVWSGIERVEKLCEKRGEEEKREWRLRVERLGK